MPRNSRLFCELSLRLLFFYFNNLFEKTGMFCSLFLCELVFQEFFFHSDFISNDLELTDQSGYILLLLFESSDLFAKAFDLLAAALLVMLLVVFSILFVFHLYLLLYLVFR